MSPQWWTEIGLFLDAIAFALLSVDLLWSMKGERLAVDEIQALERASFARRYGVYAPSKEVMDAQQQEFDRGQKRRKEQSERDMRRRTWLACLAILLAVVGLGMQLYGGWPT